MQSDTTELSRRRRETQSRLLDAAAEVFAEFGLQGASVEQICNRADFTRGAFYSNFSSKEELFAALLHREYERRAALIREQANALARQLAETPDAITPATAALYVTEFVAATQPQAQWFALETEFLLMSLRDPTGATKFSDFGSLFQSELTRLVEQLLCSAGRKFTLPTDLALDTLGGVFERAQRLNALDIHEFTPETQSPLRNIGEQVATILFAITTEQNTELNSE